MGDDLRQLYQDMILEHARKPRNFGELEEANRQAHGDNPLCGDQVTVYLKMDGDSVKDISFKGHGCAISTAAASVMTELAKGKETKALVSLFKQFQHTVVDDDDEETSVSAENLPKKLKVFTGVKAYPMRVKCATLAWHTLHAALENKQQPVTTE